MLRLAGATLVEVPDVPYNPNNYVKYSGRLAEEIAETNPNRGIWGNQVYSYSAPYCEFANRCIYMNLFNHMDFDQNVHSFVSVQQCDTKSNQYIIKSHIIMILIIE